MGTRLEYLILDNGHVRHLGAGPAPNGEVTFVFQFSPTYREWPAAQVEGRVRSALNSWDDGPVCWRAGQWRIRAGSPTLIDGDFSHDLEFGATRLDRSVADPGRWIHSFGIEFRERTILSLLPDDIVDSAPSIIRESLGRFFARHPDPQLNVFVIMQFGLSPSHVTVADEIADAIRCSLHENGLVGLRADDAHFSDDLYGNIITYIHGC